MQHGATEFEALPTRHVADPTGAGDCFATTFLVRYAETASIGEAMRYAWPLAPSPSRGTAWTGIPARAAPFEDRLEQVAA
ncbi:MAG: PfkB family carbohydrate kinase [Dehalococcoidia bacterium]|nr:PfkB family carbohydrate kinase [Dehalococcoidia bacterium]